MNKLLITVVCVTIIGCTTSTKQEDIIIQQKIPTLLCHVVDLSRSTNQLSAYNDSNIARRIYYTLANQGTGTIAIVYLGANSSNEEVVTIPIVSFDTVNPNTIDNSYLRNKAIRANKEAKERFDKQAEANIRLYVSAISKPHDQQFSDVSNTLSLISVITKQSNYQSHRKLIAIFSDLEHCPRDSKHNKLKPVVFDRSTILCFRPTLSEEQLNNLFSQDVNILTSPQDILSFLQTTN